MTLNIDVEALTTSATKVCSHGDDLSAGHSASAGRVSSAGAGWRGRSAGALSDRAAQWATRSSDLVTRIDTQGQHMATSAERFREREEQSRQRLDGVYGGDGGPAQPTAGAAPAG
ncbi:WXG100 family type VII secretion target [Mycolicibacterium palauense]|uniref:WXG100 family type VII secretion target n=1 Tax=Mycolicibacterium palauense TaxID=2034511 RepID=UPI000BFEC7F3|nr:WXG100 family type VII secretion target [Mycolicibacterium palauense]